MSVPAISSSTASQSTYATLQAERAEPKGAGGRDLKNDHDADDRAQAPSGSTSNASGQTIGTILNVKA